MAKKQVIWSTNAREELFKILDFYTERNGSPTYSLHLLDKIESWNELIERFPFIGKVSQNGYTRVVVVEYYLIFYNIGDKFIEVVSFWDNRQDPIKRIDN